MTTSLESTIDALLALLADPDLSQLEFDRIYDRVSRLQKLKVL